jgi:hypothetical protein
MLEPDNNGKMLELSIKWNFILGNLIPNLLSPTTINALKLAMLPKEKLNS